MRKEALIFDHDGTLVDSIDAVVFCTNLIIKKAGYPEAEPAEIRHGMAYPTLERFSFHTAENDLEILKQMSRDFYISMNEKGVSMVSLYPGIKESLDRLARAGFSLGLLTNNQGIFTRRVAARLKYSYDMEIILGEDNVPAPKPDPRGLLQVCAGLGARPEDSWYIGDGKPDFDVAGNAGLNCALVSWGAHPKSELEKLGPRKLFDSAGEMADFFCSRDIRHPGQQSTIPS